MGRAVLTWGTFPAVMGGSVVGAALAMAHLPAEAVVFACTLAAALAIAVLERVHPYEPRWNEVRGDVRTDFVHAVVSMGLLPKLVDASLFALFAGLAARASEAWGAALWPGHLPVAVQLPLALVIGELGGYWAHRATHEIPWLWRLHAVHHSAERLYFLNAARFHPLDTAFGYALHVGPLVLLGVEPELLALTTVVTSVHGMFQHANVELRLGPLNWVFSMAELHRWHHCPDPVRGNTNYGANLIVWDIVFGTRFLPADQEAPRAIGIGDMPSFPRGYLAQLVAPWRWEALLGAQTPPTAAPGPVRD